MHPTVPRVPYASKVTASGMLVSLSAAYPSQVLSGFLTVGPPPALCRAQAFVYEEAMPQLKRGHGGIDGSGSHRIVRYIYKCAAVFVITI